MKKIRFASVILASALLLAAQETRGDSKTFTLKQDFSPKLEYTGDVEYSITAVVSFESKGRLSYVAPVGRSVESSVFDLDGSIVHEGDLLAKQDTGIPENDLRLAEIRVKEAEITLVEKKETYLRDKRLYEKKAVSTKQFLESQLIYETALFAKEKAELEVKRCKRVLDACYSRAPFNGVVEEVYQVAGAAVDVAHKVLKVSAVSPIKVTVKLPEDVTRHLDQTIRILIWPVDSLTPVQGWFDDRGIRTGRLISYVENPLNPLCELTPEERNLPQIDNLSVVTSEKLQWKPDMIWISFQALKQDDKGYYVWKLKGVKALDLKTPLHRVNVLEKVRVKASELEIFRGIYRLRGIEQGSGVDIHDVLAVDVPDSVKNGDRAVYRTTRRLFRPGERVNVVLVPAVQHTGFYIPEKAVFRNPETEEFYVQARSGEKTIRIPVYLYEKLNHHVRVKASQLKEGTVLVYGD